jgi:predicted amidohydrolase
MLTDWKCKWKVALREVSAVSTAAFTAAVVQLNCNRDIERNLAQAQALIRSAAGAGASFVATPENTNYLGPQGDKARLAQPLDGELCTRFGALASELKIHLLLGSFNEKGPVPNKCYNTSVLFGPDGQRLAHYRKMHLFDVEIGDEVKVIESDTVVAGDELVTATTGLGTFGLSICYDLRFAELYRRLTDGGATLITVPSAFTATTGKDHWETLLRARAIETQCFVFAPAQVGEHDDEGLRDSWGHSMIIDPWGRVLAEVEGREPGFALAKIEPELIDEIRRAIPVSQHRKLK